MIYSSVHTTWQDGRIDTVAMHFNRENTTNCPCKECEFSGCGARHSTCKAYAEWRKKVDAKSKAERDYYASANVMSEAKKRILWKRKRYSNYRGNVSRNND